MPLNQVLAQSSNQSSTTARTGSAGQSDSRSQRCLFCLQTHNWSSRPSQSWAVLYHGSQKVLQSTRLAYIILYSQINKQRSSLVLWKHHMNTTTNTWVTLKWLSPGMTVNTRDINFTKGTSSTAIYLTAMPSSSPGFQSGSDSGHPKFQISSSFLSLQQFSAADLPAPQVWAWSWAETHAERVLGSPFSGHDDSLKMVFQPFRCDYKVEQRHTGRLEETDLLAALTSFHYNSNSSRCCRSSAVIMKLNKDTLEDWGQSRL